MRDPQWRYCSLRVSVASVACPPLCRRPMDFTPRVPRVLLPRAAQGLPLTLSSHRGDVSPGPGAGTLLPSSGSSLPSAAFHGETFFVPKTVFAEIEDVNLLRCSELLSEARVLTLQKLYILGKYFLKNVLLGRH